MPSKTQNSNPFDVLMASNSIVLERSVFTEMIPSLATMTSNEFDFRSEIVATQKK